MSDTKERILLAALRLFAENGYEAVSVSDIARALGVTKGALYRHYESKRAIFDSILRRMEERDAEQARESELPEGTPEEAGEAYEAASFDHMADFAKAMFRYWTEDEFAARFRKLLTLEQFRSPEMGALYQQYLGAGPLGYMTDLFAARGLPRPQQEAAGFYGPMFLLYSVYDGAEDKAAVTALLDEMMDDALAHLKESGENTMDKEKITFRGETAGDHRAVENMIRESFWNVYHPGCSEHYVIHVLRDDPAFVKELDLVMEKDGQLIGQNMFMRTVIEADDGRVVPILTMGPICITPELKRRGYGKMLLDYSLEKAAAMGFGAVLFEGNIGFYGKSGFDYARKFGIRYHDLPEGADDSFFLCRELIPGYLSDVTGVYQTPKGYYVDAGEVEESDKLFPPKVKEKLPGQLER